MWMRRLSWLVTIVFVFCGFIGLPAALAQDQEAKKPDADADPYVRLRNRMVDRHIAGRGIKNKRVLKAFRTVPRHEFMPPGTQRQPYDNESIPIGEGQTITPPYDVAFMTEILDPKPTDVVYEVGTGSGYQSAILSQLVKEVYSVEIHKPLSQAHHQGSQETGLQEYSHPRG